MLGKSLGSNEEREYSEKEITTVLKEWYGNYIRLDEYSYIVCEEGVYYLMKKKIPEIFFTDDAIKLENMSEITEENHDSVVYKVTDGDHIHTVYTRKQRALQEIMERWAV